MKANQPINVIKIYIAILVLTTAICMVDLNATMGIILALLWFISIFTIIHARTIGCIEEKSCWGR